VVNLLTINKKWHPYHLPSYQL